MSDFSKENIVIIGGGVTGLTTAAELSLKHKSRVVVVEKEKFLGGLASTLSRDGLRFDLGSHRIHNDFLPIVLEYFEKIGVDLLKRQRKGMLYYDGRFLRYPPRLFNLLKNIPLPKNIKFGFSYLRRLPFQYKGGNNYSEVMLRRVGEEIYTAFYKDASRKLWGSDPSEMDFEKLQRRFSSINLRSMLKNISGKADYFLYPKKGIGEIAQILQKKIAGNGAKILKGAKVKNITREGNKIKRVAVEHPDGSCAELEVSLLISTIPIDSLYSSVFKVNKEEVSLAWRNLRLLYMQIDETMDTDAETFYFPSLDIRLGRVSEINKYSPFLNPFADKTLLSIEIPSSGNDLLWHMNDKELLDICIDNLVKTGLLKQRPKVIKYFTLNLDKAYPAYRIGWREKFSSLYFGLNRFENLFTIGRKGLFLHCNIDHCMVQALELAKFILNGTPCSKDLWDSKAGSFLGFYARD